MKKRSTPVGLGVFLVLAAATTLLAATASASRSAAPITAPPNIASAGKIVWCSDLAEPPILFIKNGKPSGSDVEIGAEIAKRMGVKAQFVNVGFDAIIASLLSKKCDASITDMNDTPSRRKVIDFVDYMRVGQSLVVSKSLASKVHSLADMSGRSVGVEQATTNADYVKAVSNKLKKQGKKPIEIVYFNQDADAAVALAAGKVDGYFTDYPIALDYIKKGKGKFALGSKPANYIDVGIGTRKENKDLHVAIQKAVDQMYADGTIQKILKKYDIAYLSLK